jgi:TetR/AcrR family transcriptional repressor of nem operon
MDRRTQILDSAKTLLLTHGPRGFSFADIAAEVGISKPSLYHHFASKHALVLTVIEREAHAMGTALQGLSAQHGCASDRLRAFLHLMREACADGQRLSLTTTLAAQRSALDEDSARALMRLMRDVHQWLAELFSRAAADHSITLHASASEEASHVLAQLQGAQLMARASGNIRMFDNSVAALRRRLKGVDHG